MLCASLDATTGAAEMIKRAWHFYCINGKGGTMIALEPIGAEEALIECRLSLGVKVMRVY